ncbi:MAG: 1-acyl-sn-glycerol-3-phosphate acyltransferase [Bacteroidota bacterium]
MIYNILKALFGLALRIYFRHIYVRNVPEWNPNRPTVFVANHQNAMIDAMLIGILLDRPLHFMSRGESFLHPFTRWLYHQFNMHPIYRKAHTPKLCYRNLQQLTHFQELLRKHPLLIFPEGISQCTPRLQPIQPGAARVILGAEAAADYQLGVQVIPVGLNYSSPHRFRSEVFLNFGAPIPLAHYLTLHAQHPRKAVRQLSQHIARAIDQHCLTIPEEQLEPLVEQVVTVYRDELTRHHQIYPWEKNRNFLLQKDLIQVLHFFEKYRPKPLERLHQELHAYFQVLQQYQLSDQLLTHSWKAQHHSPVRLHQLLYWLGLPLYWYGYLHHWPARQIAHFFSYRKQLRPDFRGSILLSVGVLNFLLTYLIAFVLMHGWSQSLFVASIYVFSLPFLGWFALHYAEGQAALQAHLMLKSMLRQHPEKLQQLLQHRQQIVQRLRAAHQFYLAQKRNKVPAKTG